MNKRLRLSLLFVFFVYVAQAQHGWHLKENAIWNFPDSLGLNFNNGLPDTFSSTVPSSPNCIASLSDPQGKLLFYTNSEYIWDKNGDVMPGGYLEGATIFYPNNTPTGKTDASSHGAPQGVLILPVIDNPSQYYVFTLAGWVFGEDIGGPASYMWLTYSIVDMTQNGGLGAKVAGPYLIDTGMSSHMTAVPGDNCNIWLVTHQKREAQFKAFEITAAGVTTVPIISNTGYTPVITPGLGNYSHGWGSMQVSPNRKKLAYTSPYQLWPEIHGGKIELFDFNAATGTVANQLTLDSIYCWDLAFSADNSKLYSTSCMLADPEAALPFFTLLHQFDVGLATPADIINSKTLIDTINSPFAVTMPLRLTKDAKIYYILSNSGVPGDADYLNTIHQPNLPGAACANEQRAVLMPHRLYPDDNTSGIGCNGFVRPIPGDTLFTRLDTILCEGQDSIVMSAPANAIYYSWSDGSVDTSLIIKHPGTYWVGTGLTYCQYRVDTFVVAPPFTFSLGNDTIICNEDSYTLTVPEGAAQYLWQDGSNTHSYTADTSGVYWVRVHRSGCEKSDTVQVLLKDLRSELGPDIHICSGSPITLTFQVGLSDPEADIVWSNGMLGSPVIIKDTGLYQVSLRDGPCNFSDSVRISYEICACIHHIPTAFSPNEDGLNDEFRVYLEANCPIRQFQCSVYNRWGQRVFYSNDVDKGWDGTWNGKPAEVGTYMYTIITETGVKATKHQFKGDITLIR